jgi:hypothetical protein
MICALTAFPELKHHGITAAEWHLPQEDATFRQRQKGA